MAIVPPRPPLKPLAPSVAVATKTIDAAKEANALGRWGVAENYRFEPAVERLASADIGTVRAVRLSVGAPITGENPYAKTAWRQAPEHVGAYFGDAGPNLCGNQPVRRVHDNSSPSHFSAMTWPSWFGRTARNRHRHAIEQASRR